MHSSTSVTYYTICTIFQCPSPSSSTRRTSQKNEGRREAMKDGKNKGTKESINERRILTYNTIQSSWNQDEFPSDVLKTTCFTMKNLFSINSMKMKSSTWHTKKEERWMKIHIQNNHNIHEKDRVYIDAYGDVIDVILAMSFLHDTLHKFLLFFFVTFFLSSSSCVCTSQTRQS